MSRIPNFREVHCALCKVDFCDFAKNRCINDCEKCQNRCCICQANCVKCNRSCDNRRAAHAEQ